MNSLTMLDNNSFLADQKFGAGDGYLSSSLPPPPLYLPLPTTQPTH